MTEVEAAPVPAGTPSSNGQASKMAALRESPEPDLVSLPDRSGRGSQHPKRPSSTAPAPGEEFRAGTFAGQSNDRARASPETIPGSTGTASLPRRASGAAALRSPSPAASAPPNISRGASPAPRQSPTPRGSSGNPTDSPLSQARQAQPDPVTAATDAAAAAAAIADAAASPLAMPPSSMRKDVPRALRVLVEKYPRADVAAFDKLYAAARAFRRYRDVEAEAIVRFGKSGVANLDVRDAMSLVASGVRSTAAHVYAPYGVLTRIPGPDSAPSLRPRSRSHEPQGSATPALRAARQLLAGGRRMSDAGVMEREAMGSVGRVPWDPLAPETEIQSTLRNRFTGRKDLQRRLKELEAKRRSRDGPPGLRMSNAGDGSEKADKHPWHKDVTEKGARLGSSLSGAVSLACPLPPELWAVAAGVEAVCAEKREGNKAYAVGMDAVLGAAHPYMVLRPQRAKEAADRVRVLSVYQEMGMLVTMQGSDDDEASDPRLSVGPNSRASASGNPRVSMQESAGPGRRNQRRSVAGDGPGALDGAVSGGEGFFAKHRNSARRSSLSRGPMASAGMADMEAPPTASGSEGFLARFRRTSQARNAVAGEGGVEGGDGGAPSLRRRSLSQPKESQGDGREEGTAFTREATAPANNGRSRLGTMSRHSTAEAPRAETRDARQSMRRSTEARLANRGSIDSVSTTANTAPGAASKNSSLGRQGASDTGDEAAPRHASLGRAGPSAAAAATATAAARPVPSTTSLGCGPMAAPGPDRGRLPSLPEDPTLQDAANAAAPARLAGVREEEGLESSHPSQSAAEEFSKEKYPKVSAFEGGGGEVTGYDGEGGGGLFKERGGSGGRSPFASSRDARLSKPSRLRAKSGGDGADGAPEPAFGEDSFRRTSQEPSPVSAFKANAKASRASRASISDKLTGFFHRKSQHLTNTEANRGSRVSQDSGGPTSPTAKAGRRRSIGAFGAALRKEDVNMSLDALRRTAHDPLYWELARPFYRIAHRSYPALSMEPSVHAGVFRTWSLSQSPRPGFEVLHAINVLRNELVVVKLFNIRLMNDAAVKGVAQEVLVRETLYHRGLDPYVGTFVHGSVIGVVTRASTAGDFLRHAVMDTPLGRMDENSVVARVLLPVMMALQHMHARGLVHRNVRPEYVVEGVSGVARLGGLQHVARADERPSSPIGPLDYMAPEMILCSYAKQRRSHAHHAAKRAPSARLASFRIPSLRKRRNASFKADDPSAANEGAPGPMRLLSGIVRRLSQRMSAKGPALDDSQGDGGAGTLVTRLSGIFGLNQDRRSSHDRRRSHESREGGGGARQSLDMAVRRNTASQETVGDGDKKRPSAERPTAALAPHPHRPSAERRSMEDMGPRPHRHSHGQSNTNPVDPSLLLANLAPSHPGAPLPPKAPKADFKNGPSAGQDSNGADAREGAAAVAVVAAGRTRISFGNGEEHVGREAGALEGEGVPLQAAVSAGGGAVTGVRPKSAVGEGRGQGMGSSPMEAPRRTAKSVRIGDDAMEATDPEMGRVHGDVAATGADGAGEGRRVRMVEVAAAPEKAGGLREAAKVVSKSRQYSRKASVAASFRKRGTNGMGLIKSMFHGGGRRGGDGQDSDKEGDVEEGEGEEDEEDYYEDDAPGGPAPRVPDLWYSDKVDTWSLGCLAFELLCGKCPFEVEDATQAAGLILFGEISQFPDYISPEAADFIRQALAKSPDARPTVTDLLSHPLMTVHTAKAREVWKLEELIEQQVARDAANQGPGMGLGPGGTLPVGPAGVRASMDGGAGSSDEEGQAGFRLPWRNRGKRAFEVPANERRRLVESLQQRMMQADLAWFIKEADVCTGRLSGGQGAGAGQSSAEAPRKRWWFGGAGRGRRTGAVAPAT